MTWVVHTLGGHAIFASVLGVIAGTLVWLVGRGARFARSLSGVRPPILAAMSVALGVAIIGWLPGDSRSLPAVGATEGWNWRWLGDIPDAMTPHLLNDYTAAIAMLNYVLFVVWGAALAWSLGSRSWPWAFAYALCFPLLLESLQRYPFGGTPSVTDAWTNILGGFTGITTWLVVSRICSRARHSDRTA